MKPDGLVTVLGEACVNSKVAESTIHFSTLCKCYKLDFLVCVQKIVSKNTFLLKLCCRAPQSSTASEFYSFSLNC